MPDQVKQSGWLWPLLFIAILFVVVAWLIEGSSNKAKQLNWIAGWKDQPALQIARRAPAAVSYNNFLYVVGGIGKDDNYVKPVEYTLIHGDGSLGPWRQTSAILEGRFYNAAIAHNGFLYTLGGGSGATGKDNFPIASIERAKINPDGSLGEWQIIGQMLSPRRGLKAAKYENTIYAIGGYDGRFLKSVERTTILPDGMLTEWQLEKHESIIDRYIHSATIAGNSIYLLGGHMRNPNQPSYSDVEASQILTDKQLSAWQVQPHGLITPRLVAESFSLGNFLYIAGGHTGSQRLNSVEVATIDEAGQLSPWRQTTPLPIARSAYATASHGMYIYLLGGGGEDSPLNSVVMAKANTQGNLGYSNE